jgi:hypothetical protein
MNTVIIAAPFEYDAQLRARLEQIGPVITGADGVLVLDDGASRVYVGRNDAMREEFEPERLGRIASLLPRQVFYSVDFSDIALCRRVLEVMVNDPRLVVDNDHGVVLPGPDFVRVLQSQRDWDWRVNAH